MQYPVINNVDKKQKGAAAVITMLMLPVLVGFMLFSLEASQLLRTKAVLGDATEAAVLATGSINSNSVDSDKRESMARRWIEVITTPSGDQKHWINKIDLDVIHCEDNDECEHLRENFEEYRIKVTGQPPISLTATSATGFQNQVVAHSAASRRHIENGAKDIYFVADFSNSMYEQWAGMEKITMLKRLLVEMAEKLEQGTSDRSPSEGKNTIALIPFSGSTYDRQEGSTAACPVVQISLDSYPTQSLPDIWREKACNEKGDSRFSPFHTVPSTTSARTIKNEITKMYPEFFTFSYEGIIRAAQLARSGSNAERIIIVLSDGEDSTPYYHNLLVSAGYCDNIRKTLDSQTSFDGQQVKSSIEVIAFSYNLDSRNPLVRCADEGKVYTAHNIEDLKNRIFTIIKGSPTNLYRRPAH